MQDEIQEESGEERDPLKEAAGREMDRLVLPVLRRIEAETGNGSPRPGDPFPDARAPRLGDG